jgi:PEP-CTERM motif-containing protein
MHSFPMRRASLHAASVACALVALLVMAPTTAHATLLGLNSGHPGDITSGYTDVTYVLNVGDPTTGTLTAVGYPTDFDVPAHPNEQGFNSGSFSLSMTVKRSTGALVSGSVTITGDTNGTPHYNGTLLTGTITGFGFVDPGFVPPFDNAHYALGNEFDFTMHVTGGLLAAPYYASHTAGIIMGINNVVSANRFTGVFTAPFDNLTPFVDNMTAYGPGTGLGTSDTFKLDSPSIPEPSTFILLGLGLIPLAWRIGRRSRHLF